MPTDYATSLQAVALRVTKLAPAGTPVTGPDTSYTTSKFTTVSFTPQYDEGDEIVTRAADGSICIHYKMPNTLKHVDLNLAICNPQPELYEMLAGGSTILQTTNIVGWKAPLIGTEGRPDGVSIEVWTRAIVNGRPATVNPYWRFVFPSVKTWMSGDRVLENGVMANTFVGLGVENAAWVSPAGASDWTYGADRAIQYARSAAIPASVDGYVVVA